MTTTLQQHQEVSTTTTTTATAGLTDAEYEHLYEAALLEYRTAIRGLQQQRMLQQQQHHHHQQQQPPTHDGEAESSLRLLVARVQRESVLHLCEAERAAKVRAPAAGSSTLSEAEALAALSRIQALQHRVDREQQRDAGCYARELMIGVRLTVDDGAGRSSTGTSTTPYPGKTTLQDAVVDVEAFFDEYPHARHPASAWTGDGDDEPSEDEDDSSDEVQCVGVKNPPPPVSTTPGDPFAVPDPVAAAPRPPFFPKAPASGSSVSSRPPSAHTGRSTAAGNMFQYTPPDTPLLHRPLEMGPAPSRTNPTGEVPPQLPSTAVPLPPETTFAPGLSTWDDHHSLNPFQTAREYAQAGAAPAPAPAPARHQQHHPGPPSQPHPPPQPPTNPYYQPIHPYYQPVVDQPPQHYHPVNPYSNHPARTAGAPPAPEPPPAPIRDSLRRKFQPPTKRSEANAASTTTAPGGRSVVARALRPPTGGGKQPRGDGSNRNDGGNNNDGDDDDDLPEALRHCGKELIDKIVGEILDGGDPVTFGDIAGLEDVKQTVQEIVCWPMKRPDLFTGLRRAPNGLLLYGPPGTGKTLIGKAIAHESGATFFSISSSSLTSKWIGEGEKLVRTLFAVAAHREPAVVFIDEIDSLLTQRKADENEASRRIKTEFLVQLDGTGTTAGRVLAIGATNRPQELDDAARRRFTKRLYIPLPEASDREALLRVLLDKNHHRLTDAEVHRLAQDTAGMSGADLKSLSTEAAMGPIRDLGARALEVDAGDVPPIAYKHFRAALRGTKPSVSPADLLQYEEFDKTYGSRRAAEEYGSQDDEVEDGNEEK